MRITLEPSPKEELEWVPLSKHPLFTATTPSGSDAASRNLLAWDGASRLYFWDSNNNCLHRLSLRLGDPDPTSILAASPSKVLETDIVLDFDVHKISINRNGTAMLLFGSERLCVMYLYGRASKKDVNLICRTINVGSQTYSLSNNDIRVLEASWHPYSDTHLGILSSDSVFRLFNLAVDPFQPEQEYYLQPAGPGRSRNASSMCPVGFSFGGDHLWDRFSVFVSFSDGAIYVLCPVVPFGSLFKCESLLEIYNDAHTFGIVSANSVAASNSKLAISWLEATFPELQNREIEGDSLSLLRAHAHAVFDASLVLQGPLRRLGQSRNEDSVGRIAECEGRAVSFLYNLVSKDSILVTAWSSGKLQIDAIADEVQPLWSVSSPPRLRLDSHEQILGLAMICESIAGNHLEKIDHNAWLGNPPPLLSLAIVDLALPRRAESGYNISLFIDTIMPERIYSLHDGGIDSIVLHFLPFTSQTSGKDDTMRTPSVHPVLNTCQSGCTSEPSLCGFVSLSDSFGYSWIVAVALFQECVVLEMKTWNLLLPLSIDMEKKPIQPEKQSKERDIQTIISKELLSGPKEVLVPWASQSLRSVAADSIEGRSTLHQYFKLFHETYVEYAHKVHLELKHHAPQLKKIINDQHSRLGDAQQKLLKVEEKESMILKRIDRAIQTHNSLEERLQQLRNLPSAHKKPLSRAERQFKSELDRFKEVELDALHSSVEALTARMRREMQASKASQQQKASGKKVCTGDDQISILKSSLEKLSLVNTENSKKVKVSLSQQEFSELESKHPLEAFKLLMNSKSSTESRQSTPTASGDVNSENLQEGLIKELRSMLFEVDLFKAIEEDQMTTFRIKALLSKLDTPSSSKSIIGFITEFEPLLEVITREIRKKKEITTSKERANELHKEEWEKVEASRTKITILQTQMEENFQEIEKCDDAIAKYQEKIKALEKKKAELQKQTPSHLEGVINQEAAVAINHFKKAAEYEAQVQKLVENEALIATKLEHSESVLLRMKMNLKF